MTVKLQFLDAVSAMRKGLVEEASQILEELLARKPDDVDALHLQGIIKAGCGSREAAVLLFQRVLQIRPEAADCHGNLATALEALGRDTEAEKHFGRALALDPQSPVKHFNLGTFYLKVDRNEEALHYLRRAVEISEDLEYLCNYAEALDRNGQSGAAEAVYRRLLEKEPFHSAAAANLGLLLHALRRYEEALPLLRQAIASKTGDLDLQLGAADCLRQLKRVPEAIEQLILFPKRCGRIWNALGALYLEMQQYDRAAESLRHAVQAQPDLAEVYFNNGRLLHENQQYADAVRSYQEALRLGFDAEKLGFSLAQSLLMQGDYELGFTFYEYRWNDPNPPGERPVFTQPEWKGQPIAGKTIFLYPEQGYGDMIQFIRFAEILAEKGATVIVLAYDPLAPLLATVPGISRVVLRSDPSVTFDYWCPACSLAYRLAVELDRLPGRIPYMYAPKQRELPTPEQGLKVGISWKGNPLNRIARFRDVPLGEIEGLLNTPNCTFYSLQTSLSAEERRWLEGKLINLEGVIEDFADTAGLLKEMDVTITVDSAIAHLAGAMGLPVWVCVCTRSDWRWGNHGPTTPWYSSARLYRQIQPMEWTEIFRRIRRDLTELSTVTLRRELVRE
jgi:tetratricopeptide (TPR) repeat protein